MRKLSVAVIAVAAFAAAGSALAAEAEAVVRPGPFDAPPAFPARRIYDRPPVYEPAVVPDVLTAPPAFPPVRLYNWTGAYVGVNGGGAWRHPSGTSVPDLTRGTYNISGGLVGGTLGYNLQSGEPSGCWGR